MYLTLSQLRKVIREELGRISDVKDPAEVGAVEDAAALSLPAVLSFSCLSGVPGVGLLISRSCRPVPSLL